MLLRVLRQQSIGVLALAIALGGVGGAASGVLNLGALNETTRVTTVRNTGPGAALALEVRPGQPPLAVDSTKLVSKLNAELLGGRRARDFALAGSVYSKTEAGTAFMEAGEAYTRGESDGRYFTRALSDDRYAAAGSSYSKAESDARYSSTGPVAGLQVMAADTVFTSGMGGGTPLTKSFVAPAAGNVVVMVTGVCLASSDDQITLSVRIDYGTQYTTKQTSPWGTSSDLANVTCSVAGEVSVEGGDPVTVTVEWTATGDMPLLIAPSLLVVFEPS